jgi:D-sedoheptulose 7-phosphate isomerase
VSPTSQADRMRRRPAVSASAATSAPAPAPVRARSVVDDHLDGLGVTLAALRTHAPRLSSWGTELAGRLRRGQRLLAAGNGGSAAEAQHLTAELVGRYRGEREPLSAIALHADTSTMTALGNDYGFTEIYARQVRAHGRPGDVLVLLSTSGRSENLLAAAEVARSLGVTVWSVTGADPNPLADLSDEAVCLPGATPSVQEAHLVAVHLLCEMVDATLGRSVVGDPGGAR